MTMNGLWRSQLNRLTILDSTKNDNDNYFHLKKSIADLFLYLALRKLVAHHLGTNKNTSIAFDAAPSETTHTAF